MLNYDTWISKTKYGGEVISNKLGDLLSEANTLNSTECIFGRSYDLYFGSLLFAEVLTTRNPISECPEGYVEFSDGTGNPLRTFYKFHGGYAPRLD